MFGTDCNDKAEKTDSDTMLSNTNSKIAEHYFLRRDSLACIHFEMNWYKLSKSVKLLGVSQNNEYIKDSSFIPPELNDLRGHP